MDSRISWPGCISSITLPKRPTYPLSHRRVGVVDLVVADVVPVVGKFTLPLAGVYGDLYLDGFWCGHALLKSWDLGMEALADSAY